MEHFTYKNGELYAEKVRLSEIAEQFGTPCYVYSQQALEQQWRALHEAFGDYPHRICYAVKANSNLSILNLFARLGSSYDIVSGGELERVIAAGAPANHIVFSGIGKSNQEIERALAVSIHCFDVESEPELQRLNTLAKQQGKIAPLALRINPDIDANTHPYIATGLKENKFGIDMDKALALYSTAASMPNLKIIGIACHIGSQLTTLSPFLEALERLLNLVAGLKKLGITIQHLNLGGGLGVRYQDEQPPAIAEYIAALVKRVKEFGLAIHLEPGRVITANAGVLLTRVEYLKPTVHKNFAIVDAAMNDLLRPALYEAWQDIVPVVSQSDAPAKYYDVVGPVCESADFLGKDRSLAIKPGDYLAILSAGAYGFSMSSNYNSRCRAAEVMVNGDKVRLVRRRETLEDLLQQEIGLLPKTYSETAIVK